MKIGIYGGTFNPPHTGHVEAAKAASRQLGLDLLIIVPSGVPPHKAPPEGAPSAETRLLMTRLAFSGVDNAVVSEIETGKRDPCYTVDTLLAVKNDFPGAELFLLTGTDMYLTLETWKDAGTILKNAIPAVFSRSSGDRKTISDYAERLLEKYGAGTVVIDSNVIEISSSLLRGMLPRREGSGYIVDTTYEYIIRSRLYDARPDWNWLRDSAYSMLDPKRIPHVAGCEHEALLLSERWGVDADDAREAAILHDITKKLAPDDNIRILAKHGIAIGALEYAEEKLLHSKTGALLAKSEFGASEAVCGAIMWHTTGRAGMSLLEKVIYLADYIEPTRDFEGVEGLRALAYADIDDAVAAGLEMSVADMTARGIIPNHTTFDALSDLNKRKGNVL